jgi:hypothetical protein
VYYRTSTLCQVKNKKNALHLPQKKLRQSDLQQTHP